MLDLAGRAVALPVAVQLRASRAQDFWQQRVGKAVVRSADGGCRPVASPLRVCVLPVGGFGAMPADDVACPVWGY